MKKNTFLIMLLLIVFFSSCVDECKDIICNAGICVNGYCDCPENYTGSNCEYEVPPARVLIHKIDLTAFSPNYLGITDWDENGLPDICLQRWDEGVFNIVFQSYTIQDAALNTTHSFTFSPPLILTDISTSMFFSVSDIDENNTEQRMGFASFTPYTINQNFPLLLLDDAQNEGDNANTKMEFHVSYEWE